MMWVTVFTDASYMPDTGVSAYGIWAKCDAGTQEHSARCPADCDNAELAEMFAMYAGVHHALKWWPDRVGGVHVVSDCKNAVGYLNYGNYQKLKRTLPATAEEITDVAQRIMFRLYDLLNRQGVRIATRWVKGHQNTKAGPRAWVNDRTDRLAYKAAGGKNPWRK